MKTRFLPTANVQFSQWLMKPGGADIASTRHQVQTRIFVYQTEGRTSKTSASLAMRANASIHQMARSARFSMMAITIVALHVKAILRLWTRR